jgi:hypothetical protein
LPEVALAAFFELIFGVHATSSKMVKKSKLCFIGALYKNKRVAGSSTNVNNGE